MFINQLWSFLQVYTFIYLLVFVSTSSVTCLLAVAIQEEGICLDKGLWGFGRHGHLFFKIS